MQVKIEDSVTGRFQVESETTRGTYLVRWKQSGNWECECPAWHYSAHSIARRECKHTRAAAAYAEEAGIPRPFGLRDALQAGQRETVTYIDPQTAPAPAPETEGRRTRQAILCGAIGGAALGLGFLFVCT